MPHNPDAVSIQPAAHAAGVDAMRAGVRRLIVVYQHRPMPTFLPGSLKDKAALDDVGGSGPDYIVARPPLFKDHRLPKTSGAW